MPKKTASKSKVVREVKETETKALAQGILNYSLAYLRSKPSKDGRILKFLNRGTPLTFLTQDSDGWTMVETQDEPKMSGYVQSVFLLKSEKEA